MKRIEFETKNISGIYKDKKIEVINYISEKLNGLNLDYKWIAEENKIDFVDKIITYYHPQIVRSDGHEGYWNLVGSNWFERISQVLNEEDIRRSKEYLGGIIAKFGAKETGRFNKINLLLNELEKELQKSEPNWDSINSYKRDIIPNYSTKKEGNYNNIADFYYAPITYTYFNKTLVEKIEQNRPNKNSNQQSNDKYDYQTSNRGKNLEEGDHPIIRRYEELATKIFKSDKNKSYNGEVKEEYQKVDNNLANEIGSSKRYLDQWLDPFRSSSDDDAPTGETYDVRQSNKKRLELLDRLNGEMEKLIAKAEVVKAENPTSAPTQEPANTTDEPPFDKPENASDVPRNSEEAEKVKSDVLQAIKNREEEIKGWIDNSLQAIDSKSQPEQEQELEKIEKQNNGQRAYQENKEKVDKLKDMLSQKGPAKYGKLAAKNIAQRISAAGALILDEETQAKLESLKNGSITDHVQVRKIEEEVIEKVNLEIAKGELNKLLQEIEDLEKKSTAKEKVDDLFKYSLSDNIYHQQIYLLNRPRVDKVLAEHGLIQSDNKTNQPSGGFFQPKVIIPVVLVALVLTAAAVVIIRNRRRKQVKVE